MPCYSFRNEHFENHANETYRCMSSDKRIDVLVKRLAAINNWWDYEGLIKNSVLIAGMLHDIGKTINHYQNDKSLEEFKFHDFVGAAIMYVIAQGIKNLGLPNDIEVFIKKVLIGLPLLHHYLHRDWTTPEKARQIDFDFELSDDCINVLIELLTPFAKSEPATAQLVNALVNMLRNIKNIDRGYIGAAIMLYYAFNGEKREYGNDPDYLILNDVEFAEKYNWFFEVATAVLNECDNKAAKSRESKD